MSDIVKTANPIKRGKRKAKVDVVAKVKKPEPEVFCVPAVCDICSEQFTSKTKLFKHLETHGFEGNNSKPVKVVLLVGWLSELQDENDGWVIDQNPSMCNFTDKQSETVEQALWRSIYAVENELSSLEEISDDVKIERPKGFSRGTSCMQRSSLLLATEPTSHGCCDTFCFQVKRWLGKGGDIEWMDKVNSFLPAHIRVLHRIVLSPAGAGEFHAENSTSQRRYEYMIPLSLVMPPNLAMLPSIPIVRRQRTFNITESTLTMDKEFPLESEEGQARVHFFRVLKKILKKFNGRKSWHNFASGGACPEEATAMRRIDRMYHKELVSVDGEPWVTFSISGDGLLKGQVRRMIGLAVGIIRGWLPESYFDAAVNKTQIAEIPAIPGWGMFVAECKYAFWEAKFISERLDPRRIEGADEIRINDWTKVVYNHIASLRKQAGDTWIVKFESDCKEMYARYETLVSLQQRSKKTLKEEFTAAFHQPFYGTRREILLKPEEVDADLETVISADKVENKDKETVKSIEITECDTPEEEEVPIVVEIEEPETPHSKEQEYIYSPQYNTVNLIQSSVKKDMSDEIKSLYMDVLRLLHEAESSGFWPLSSTGRQKVITENTLVENGGYGGSFSVGCLPKHLAQPKGNIQFPGKSVHLVLFAFFILIVCFCFTVSRVNESLLSLGSCPLSQQTTVLHNCHQQACSVPPSQRQWCRQRAIYQLDCRVR